MNVTEVRRCEMKWSSEPNFQNCFSIVVRLVWLQSSLASTTWFGNVMWEGLTDGIENTIFSVANNCQVQVNSAGHANVF